MTTKGSISRQKPLGDAQAREGLKVLKKFVEKKYRFSVASLSTEFLDTIEPTSPTKSTIGAPPFTVLGPTQSLLSYDRLSVQQPLLNTGFASSVALASQHGNSVVETAREIPPTEHVKRLEGEMKRSYIHRICKHIIAQYRTGINNILLIVLLALFALAGGLLFYHLEVDAEKLDIENAIRETERRHRQFALRICNGFAFETMRPTLAEELVGIVNVSNDNCTSQMLHVLLDYDQAAGISPEPSGWRWDFWNAVFYAGTVFTTIGYGNLHCKTIEGRVATIFYAIVGVPFMLVVLNAVGKTLYNCFHRGWEVARRKFKLWAVTLNRRIFGVREDTDTERLKDGGVLENNFDDCMNLTQGLANADIFETFPLSLAVVIIVIYVALCSAVFCVWEEWPYFTAFYFFFISMMTIGFGDEMPKHPHNACAFFIFFIIGLALFSMCLSIMQMRVENRYMAALNLIDEEQKKAPLANNYQELDPTQSHTELFTDVTLPSESVTDTEPVKWRSQASAEEHGATSGCGPIEATHRYPYCRMSSNASNSANDDIISPVLGVFMARSKSMRASKKSLSRLNSTQSRDGLISPAPGTPGSLRHSLVHSHPADTVDSLTVSENCTRTITSAEPIGAVSPSLVSSQSSVGNRSIPSFTAPLSVITEATDEESESGHHRAKRKRPPPLKVAAAALDENIPDRESDDDSHPERNIIG